MLYTITIYINCYLNVTWIKQYYWGFSVLYVYVNNFVLFVGFMF